MIHIKMMVVDDAVTVITNQNLTQTAFTTNREFGVVTNRPDTVQAAAIYSLKSATVLVVIVCSLCR